MGIYFTDTKTHPTFDLETGLTTWTEHRAWPGYVTSRTVTATAWVETERTACFCCSCGDREGSDVYCRNHGYGFGERPCEAHNLPGSTMVDPETEQDTGRMPDSVQSERRRLSGDAARCATCDGGGCRDCV